MRPKGKLFALLAIFAAIGLVTATGAFTSVEATRTAEVNVAGDAEALLQLQPHNGPNGYGPTNQGTTTNSQGYAQLTDGNLEINLGGFDNQDIGSGVNTNATTEINGVFNITNAGTQTVYVNISDTASSENRDDYVVFHNASTSGLSADTTAGAGSYGGLEIEEGGSYAELTEGQTMVVDITIHIDGVSGASGWDGLIDEITISASATSPDPGNSHAVA